MSEEFSLTIEEIAREVPRVNLEVGKIYEVRFTNTNRGPIKTIYIGFSPSKRRKLKRIFLEIDSERTRAYAIGEDYEVLDNVVIVGKSIREVILTDGDIKYIEQKGLLR